MQADTIKQMRSVLHLVEKCLSREQGLRLFVFAL